MEVIMISIRANIILTVLIILLRRWKFSRIIQTEKKRWTKNMRRILLIVVMRALKKINRRSSSRKMKNISSIFVNTRIARKYSKQRNLCVIIFEFIQINVYIRGNKYSFRKKSISNSFMFNKI